MSERFDTPEAMLVAMREHPHGHYWHKARPMVEEVVRLREALQQIEPLAGQLASMDSGIGKEIHWRARAALSTGEDADK